jgi:4-amino-4-deoxy-L-arabinose transferase-like glycosyltransferase
VRNRALSILLLLAVPVFFVWLGANSIWDANEAFYVETPRQMLRSGDYINPSFNALPRFNKPVLSYWIVAGLYHVLGDSVTTERIGIAIGALGIMAAAFLVGRAVRSTSAGLLAALIVATSPRVVWFARRIFIDVYLTMFMSMALAFFVLAERHPDHRRRYLLLMYVAVGLGVLTKGPVALALPSIVLLVWLALERRLGDLKRMELLPGALIVLAIVVPWYAAVYRQHGWTYITEFFIGENLGRYTTAMTPGERGFWFYLPVLLGDLFPWAPLVVVPLIASLRPPKPGSADAQAGLRGLLGLWIVVFVVVFSFSRTKEDLYIFPTAIAVAVLVSDALCDVVERRTRALRVSFLIVAGLCVAVAPLLHWLFGPTAGYYQLSGSTWFAVILGLTGCLAFWLWIRGHTAQAILGLAAGFIVLNYLFVGVILPAVERSKPVPPLARTLAMKAVPGAKFGYFNMGLQSFVYYSNRPAIEEIGVVPQAQSFFLDNRESWALMGEDEWTAVHALVPDTCIADQHPLSIIDAKIEDIVNRRPPAEVLLVKNRCAPQ